MPLPKKGYRHVRHDFMHFSTAAATLNKFTSENGSETNIKPTGNPVFVNPAGMEMAQSPNKLANLVFLSERKFCCE